MLCSFLWHWDVQGHLWFPPGDSGPFLLSLSSLVLSLYVPFHLSLGILQMSLGTSSLAPGSWRMNLFHVHGEYFPRVLLFAAGSFHYGKRTFILVATLTLRVTKVSLVTWEVVSLGECST